VKDARRRFSIARFALLVALQAVLVAVAWRFLLPESWSRQLAAGPLRFAAAFVGIHLFLSFFEWFFHRYVLHGIFLRWLGYFARGHRNHHGLTPIRLGAGAPGSDRFILNDYPITRPEQYPDSAFPMYSLAAFWVLFAPLWIGLQFLMPGMPILLAGFTAVLCSMSLYEILHAMEHYPYEWWKRATEHPRQGWLWRRIYGFHHMHHANIGCNESISGFFGLPIPDWCLGTYHQPRELLLADRRATARDFALRPPPRWVAAMDRWARRREAGILRAREARAGGVRAAPAAVPGAKAERESVASG
jgi:hemolysin III